MVTCEYREPLLTASSVSLSLGQRPVLRDVDLEIRNLVRPG